MKEGDSLLDLNLQVDYRNKPGVIRRASLLIRPGEVVGLIGQSGSGKSTLALAILGLLNLKGGRASGKILFQGRDLAKASEREMRRIRGRHVGLVLQSPLSSLNPALRIGTQLREAWRAHSRDRKAGELRIQELLKSVSLPADPDFLRRFPREISIGQAQRVLIAMALIHKPSLLIADEPTSALDVITQAEVLRLFGELNRQYGTAVLFISHDLLSVANLCSRVAILNDGEIVEQGLTDDIFQRPQHPYTKLLVHSLPKSPWSTRDDLMMLSEQLKDQTAEQVIHQIS